MRRFYFLYSAMVLTGAVMAQSKEYTTAMNNGNAKYKIKSYNLAILDYDAAIKAIPESEKMIISKTQLPPEQKYIIEPYERRANCYYYAGNMDKMKQDVDRVLAMDSSNVDAKALMAAALYKSGKKAEGCVGMITQAKKGSEVASRAYKDCFCVNEGTKVGKEAITANGLKKYDEALDKSNKAIALMPDSGYVHAEKGIALFGLGKNDEALKSLSTAIHLSKKNYKAYYNRAQLYLKINNLDSAQEDMNMCMKLNPTFYDGYYLRAKICEDQQQWSSAIFDLKQCIRLHPTDGKLDLRIAEIYHNKLDDLYEACPFYRSASEKGNEAAAEMAGNCNNKKYMKANLKNAKK